MTRIFPDLLHRYFPILTWGTEYSRRTLDSPSVEPVTIGNLPTGWLSFYISHQMLKLPS